MIWKRECEGDNGRPTITMSSILIRKEAAFMIGLTDIDT
jgi:hypothetical protein